ncbi:MAG: hypothetical protein QW456_04960, partial [Ignisphaera sp.]
MDLNHRERFLRTFEFRSVDRVPNYEFGYWNETIDRWHREGLPIEVKTSNDIEQYLGLEGIESLEFLPIAIGIWPNPPSISLKKENDREMVADGLGGIFVKKVSTSTIPQYIRHPIRNRDDWKRLKPFF